MRALRYVALLLVLLLAFTGLAFGTGGREEARGEAGEISGELSVYAFAGPIREEFWQYAVDAFNERYPDVEVELVANARVHDQVRPLLVAGNPPDVYFNAGAGRITVDQLFAEELIIPLDEMLDGPAWDSEGTMRDSILSYRLNVLEGETWGLQLPFHLIGFFYNQQVFEDNGWGVPTNFEEFRGIAEDIMADGVTPISTTGVYPYYWEHFVLRGAVAAAGGRQAFIDWAELRPGFFESDVFLDPIRRYEEVIQNGWLLEGSEARNHTESQLEWIFGNAAMVTSGTWIESEMSADYPDGFTDDIRFLPTFFVGADEEPVISPYGNASVAIFQGGNEAAAQEFVRALYSVDVMSTMTEMTNIMSNVPAANDNAEKSPAITSALEAMDRYDQIAWPEGGYLTNEVTAALSAQLQSLMIGGTTAEELGAAVEAAAERVRNDSSVPFIPAYFPE